jgi:hypothetical protein
LVDETKWSNLNREEGQVLLGEITFIKLDNVSEDKISKIDESRYQMTLFSQPRKNF